MSRGIPALIQFHKEYAEQSDRFAIVSVCLDHDGQFQSIADLNEYLQPVVAEVWKEPLPFPVLLDNSFATFENWGLESVGVTALIDPRGILAPGDEKNIAEKLK